jgi:hypothetical protein
MKKARHRKIKTYTVAECNAELGTIRKKYKETKRSFRDEFRMTLQRTQIVLGRVSKSTKLTNAYRSSVLKERKSGRGVSKVAFDLSLEIVSQATGAVGRKARALASKRARVLDYLRELLVPASETAAFIKKEGFENLYNKSVLKKKEAAVQCKGQNEQATETTNTNGRGGKKSHKAKIKPNPITNDQTVAVTVMMSLSDRDKIAESKIETDVTLYGVIVRAGVIKVSSAKLDSEEDEW